MDRRIANFTLAILFLVFAFLQFNDTDPYLWVSIYGVMAIFTGLAAFKIYYKRLTQIAIVLVIAYSFFYVPSLIEWLTGDQTELIFNKMSNEQMFIEESREFFGLVISAVALYYVMWQSKKR